MDSVFYLISLEFSLVPTIIGLYGVTTSLPMFLKANHLGKTLIKTSLRYYMAQRQPNGITSDSRVYDTLHMLCQKSYFVPNEWGQILRHPAGSMGAYLVARHGDISVLTLFLNPDIILLKTKV